MTQKMINFDDVIKEKACCAKKYYTKFNTLFHYENFK